MTHLENNSENKNPELNRHPELLGSQVNYNERLSRDVEDLFDYYSPREVRTLLKDLVMAWFEEQVNAGETENILDLLFLHFLVNEILFSYEALLLIRKKK
jgi:hypothetical protein